MVGWTLQHSWIELWRVWWQSVAIVSSPSLILSPSYAASMPYQAPPASLRHQCCANCFHVALLADCCIAH